MNAWAKAALGEVAVIERIAVQPGEIQSGQDYVGLESIDRDGVIAPVKINAGELASTKFSFSDEHILYGKLRPYLRKIACPEFAGICSTDILPIRPGPSSERRFLYHFLRRPETVEYATARSVGINLPRISPNVLAGIEIPFPPLAEQRRIADILDRAEALRARRRAALAQLDSLNQAIFLEMFGDPVANRRKWPAAKVKELLAAPLRNGLSPSHGGAESCQVLTLSAITGNEFDDSSIKSGRFKSPPGPNSRVNCDDLLVCRGNGNARLVGKGYFPYKDLPDVVFPDTMIAARFLPDVVTPTFLQFQWNSASVRRQIEKLARTTNGTFKVNHTGLESVSILLPPLPLQQEFAHRAAAVERLKTTQRAHLAELDALFSCLQHRAFRGEL